LRDHSHPFLFLAGSALMAATLWSGVQSAPEWFSGAGEHDRALPVLVAEIPDTSTVSLHTRQRHDAATVKPTGQLPWRKIWRLKCRPPMPCRRRML
jgi:hypothetical protein